MAARADADTHEHEIAEWSNDSISLPPLDELSSVAIAAADSLYMTEQLPWPAGIVEMRRRPGQFRGPSYWKRAARAYPRNIDVLQEAHAELNRLTVVHDHAHVGRIQRAESAELKAAAMGTAPQGTMTRARALSVTFMVDDTHTTSPTTVQHLLDACAYLADTPGGVDGQCAAHDARMTFLAGESTGRYLDKLLTTREPPVKGVAYVGKLHVAWVARPDVPLEDGSPFKYNSRLVGIEYRTDSFNYAKALLQSIREILYDDVSAPPTRLRECFGDMNYQTAHSPPGEDIHGAYETSMVRVADEFFGKLCQYEEAKLSDASTLVDDGAARPNVLVFSKMWARLVPQPLSDESPKLPLNSKDVSFAALLHYQHNPHLGEEHGGDNCRAACALLKKMRKEGEERVEKENKSKPMELRCKVDAFGMRPPISEEEQHVGFHALVLERVLFDLGPELSAYGVANTPGDKLRWHDNDTMVDAIRFSLVPVDESLLGRFYVLPCSHRNVYGKGPPVPWGQVDRRNAIFTVYDRAVCQYASLFPAEYWPDQAHTSSLGGAETTPRRTTPFLSGPHIDWLEEERAAAQMAIPFSHPGQRLCDIHRTLQAECVPELMWLISEMAQCAHEGTLLEGVREASRRLKQARENEKKRRRSDSDDDDAPDPPPAKTLAKTPASAPDPPPTSASASAPDPPPDPGPLPPPKDPMVLSTMGLERLLCGAMGVNLAAKKAVQFDNTLPAKVAFKPLEDMLSVAFGVGPPSCLDDPDTLSELRLASNATARAVLLLRRVRARAPDVKICALAVRGGSTNRLMQEVCFYNVPAVGEIVPMKLDQLVNRCRNEPTPNLRIMMWAREEAELIFLPRRTFQNES